MRFFTDTNIDFIGKRKISFFISAVMILLSFWFIFIKKPNWGIDFTGGVLMQIEFEGETQEELLREVFQNAGIEEVGIQSYGDQKNLLLRFRSDYATEEGLRQISSFIEEGLPDAEFEVVKTEMVGPVVGGYLRGKALMAFFLAFVGMSIYVAWRFQGGIWGLTAVLALIHDVLVVFGLLAFLGVTIDLTVMAALLTLVGYSINDTIVIYDRIRENIKIHYKASLEDVINISINTTLSRTTVTSLTTLLVVIAIFLKGVDVLRGFSTALLAGIFVGTYSSIFLASPMVFIWHRRK
ncbi:MAG: protein translocase subunit SecF [Elusimicrobia bacterium]|nr:protein translocase subunit SecF [Elusimicrobiota bacterium]